MANGEVERLRRLLEKVVRASGRSQRDVERSLGVSQGYLTQLFNGRLELRVKHIVLITNELGLGPGEFFRSAYPPARTEPERAAARPPRRAAGPAPSPAAFDPAWLDAELERFDAHIRKLLAELLTVWLQRLTLENGTIPTSGARPAVDTGTDAPDSPPGERPA